MFTMSDSSDGLRVFAATVVHEVRTPLSSLRLCVEALACAEGLSARDRRRVELALGQIDHLEDLAAQMRFLSAQSAPAPDPTDVNGVVREVAKEVEGASRGVRVCVRCDAGLPQVQAGRGPVRSVLLNLCHNGLRAMERGGTLWISTRRAPPDGVEVAVQDTGCGIPASEMDRLFDPFFTTRPGGMGMGLAIVRSVAESQGGSVRVESALGRGTTMTVWFRAHQQEVGHASGAGD